MTALTKYMNFKPLLYSNLNIESIAFIHEVATIRELNDSELEDNYRLTDIIVWLNNCLYRKFVPQTIKSLLLK